MVTKRKTTIGGQFSARLIEMLESPAYRVLSLSARRVLDRIEIEHAHHGGTENGRLPITYDHFEEYAEMDRHAVARAIRELEALGFIEVTERGCAGNAVYRRPNRFRLTYRPMDVKVRSGGDGCTHEWRRISSMKEAQDIAALARAARGESRNPVRKKHLDQCAKSAPIGDRPVGKNHTTVPVGKNPITSISREPGAEVMGDAEALPLAA